MTMPAGKKEATLAPEQAWRSTYNQLEILLEPAQFATWLRDASFHGYEDGVFVIDVVHPYALQMLQERLYRNVRRVLRDVCGRDVELRFQLRQDAREETLTTPKSDAPMFKMLSETGAGAVEGRPPPLRARVARPEMAATPHCELNDGFTFARFLVSRDNELLYNAASAVVDAPGRAYSPLLLYGGVGLGKTHLLQAMAHALAEKGLRAIYLPSEVFTNDLVSAIRQKTTALFRDRYRKADALLVDDIQFLAGKESTQLEFFHTFNELVNGGRQIVLASDRHPRQLIGVQERLVSRFAGGLTLDIQPPEYETRLAILRMWAREEGLPLPEEVVAHLAEQGDGNIRNLRGLFQRALAQERLQRQPLTLAQARQFASSNRRSLEIAPRAVVAVVAARYELPAAALYGARRNASISRARQVAMYLIRELTALSLPQIGKLLGRRSHTTVLHGWRNIRALLDEDEELRAQVSEISEDLKRGQ